MATKRKVIKLIHNEATNIVKLVLECSHTFEIKGWSIVCKQGPIDMTYRECAECEFEGDVSRTNKAMVNLRERVVRVLEAKLSVGEEEIELNGKSVAAIDATSNAVDAALEQLGARLENEAVEWKHGPRSMRISMHKITNTARGVTE